MSKEFKKELFNIYDIVVFEDESGITQDCVCVIGKDKEVDKIVDMVECNYHSISIYENGSYKVWEKDGKNKPYYATNKKIIHLYTLKNDNRFYEVYPKNDYESINNTELSEALECLERIDNTLCLNNIKGKLEFGIDTEEHTDCDSVIGMTEDLESIKATLLKAEQDKKKATAWDIVISKNVDMLLIKKYDNVSDYNSAVWLSGREKLTEDEFKLLKEWILNE